MKFIHKIISSVQAAFNYRLERITTNMPLRMKVGKFGIWLAEVGRILQVRYANWNGEFRLKNRLLPKNPDICEIHVSEMVTDRPILTFDSPGSQPNKQTPMVKDLFNIQGISEVWLNPYEISIKKARVFSWQEILPEVDRVILEHLTGRAN